MTLLKIASPEDHRLPPRNKVDAAPRPCRWHRNDIESLSLRGLGLPEAIFLNEYTDLFLDLQPNDFVEDCFAGRSPSRNDIDSLSLRGLGLPEAIFLKEYADLFLDIQPKDFVEDCFAGRSQLSTKELGGCRT